MTVDKTLTGYWMITEIVAGYLQTRKYMGYTRSEAIRAFKKEFNL